MFNLPELRYEYDALEPFIDAKTMEIHHTKHHQAYIDNLNDAWSELEKNFPEVSKMSLENVLKMRSSSMFERKTLEFGADFHALLAKIENNGGGHLNHSLFWRILRPVSDGQNLPSSKFLAIIEKNFGTFSEFQAQFKQAALGRFGSGWAWLVADIDGNLVIDSSPNQDYRAGAILGLDVWEHAYYLNYQNRRTDYVDAFWSIVDWAEVEKNYFEIVNGGDMEYEEGRCEICLDDKTSLRLAEETFNEEELADAEFLLEEFEKEQQSFQKSVEKRVLYTDGSASPNPGPGGFAVIENGTPIFLGGEENSTNIRMEGLALKSALEILSGQEAEIWTDSEFWLNVLTKWAPAWQKSGWKKKSGEIKNLDIVKPLFELYQNSHAEIKWLRGHAGHEFNEIADEWANRARAGERV